MGQLESKELEVQPPPEIKGIAPHYDQHTRGAVFVCQEVMGADWRVEPERLLKGSK